jgi:cobalt-zinc-cadmium efflux system outer membrane protein
MRRVTGATALPGLLVLAVSITAPRAVPAQVANDTLRIEQVLSIASEMNPAVQAAVLRAKASSERAAQAGALPDPTLSLGLMNWAIDGFGPSEPMSMNSVQLTQRFPWPGKLGFSEERARRLAEAQSLDASETEVALYARVKSVYYQLAYIDRSLEIMADTRELLRNFQEVASTMYAVGSGLQQDVLQAEVAVAQMSEDITVMEQMRIAMAARLNALLGREATTQVSGLELPPVGGELPPAEDLITLAVATRPALRAAEQRIQAAEAGYRAARRMLYPDVSVTLGYGQRPDFRDLATVMVGVSIPIFAGSRQLPLRREMAAMRSLEQARAMDLYNETFARLSELRAEAERARSLSDLYNTSVLPQARAAVESALSAYRVGAVDYMTLVTNQMTVNRYAIQTVRLIADHHRAVAGIEALVGGEIGGN